VLFWLCFYWVLGGGFFSVSCLLGFGYLFCRAIVRLCWLLCVLLFISLVMLCFGCGVFLCVVSL